MSLTDKIQSLRETVGGSFVRPDKHRMYTLEKELWSNDKALKYLIEERGLDKETIKHFRLGYDKEKNAIAIPITKDRRLINIKYRFLEPKDAKYIGERGAETWIYNEQGLTESDKRVVIVEGEFDLMSVWQSGIKNVVSPASGKDSYGVWIELLDKIPKILVAYDNDSGGKETSLKMADRLGVDKCYEVLYPQDTKDANQYFKTKGTEDFKALLKRAKPFYNREFKGLGDVINSLRQTRDDIIETEFIPNVKMEGDWIVMISGKSNVGKTSYVMNLADDITKQQIPTLVLPFERGVDSVGKRFLQVKYDKTIDDFSYMKEEEWEELIDDCSDTPIYLALPKKEELIATIVKAKRLFNTRVVIIDHLDYIIRQSGNKETEIANTLQNLKRVAEDNKILLLIVTHIRKIDTAGAVITRKPSIEDLKGSSSLYQDPECVVMLNSEAEGQLEVDVVKNKGEMSSRTFSFKADTGKLENDGLTEF